MENGDKHYAVTDHDLLIALHTKFDVMHPELNRKVDSVITALEGKATKKDVDDIGIIVENHGKRIGELENVNKLTAAHKDGVWDTIRASWKIWLGISAVVYFVIAVYNQMPKT